MNNKKKIIIFILSLLQERLILDACIKNRFAMLQPLNNKKKLAKSVKNAYMLCRLKDQRNVIIS